MLRELAEAVDVCTTVRPLVLVLEDLHWSDDATLDWLVYMARRREPARCLILGTYRPVDAARQGHAVRRVQRDLQVRGQCAGLAVPSLSPDAVAAYLAQRLPGVQLPVAFPATLHLRTGGNPLFIVTLVEALLRQGVFETGRAASSVLAALATGLPDTLRQLLELQVEQLSVEEQTLLEAASVAGGEFAVAAVAAAIAWDMADVEERCALLARREHFVRACGTDAWPDGTMATRYAFRHALHRETLYERIPVGRRVRWHRQVGLRLEAGYASQAQTLAAELAEHFVRGHDPVRAVTYLHAAGEQAVQRSAHQEALPHLTQGLTLLDTWPEGAARLQQALALYIALGQAWSAIKGFVAPEVEQAYVRARALCDQVGETPHRFTVLWGLWRCYHGRGDWTTAQALGIALGQCAAHAADPTHRLEVHDALGYNALYLGAYRTAQGHLAQGMALTNLEAERALMRRRGLASGVTCHAMAANVLWCLGYPTQALQRCAEALALAQELAHPYSVAAVRYWMTFLHYRRRDAVTMQAHAEALLHLATAQGFPLYAGFATCWLGWARAMQGAGAAGLAQLQQGLAAIAAAGHTLPR